MISNSSDDGVAPAQLRATGIDVIGYIAWGTHLCNFFETKQDLLDMLVPYFKAGLERNEFCLWITSDPITVDDAIRALAIAIPDIDKYISQKKIEILSHSDWYLNDGSFDVEKVTNLWFDKLNQALSAGYDGVRANGNESWLESETWEDFIKYERTLNNLLSGKRMIILCAYPLSKCDAGTVLDVAHAHDCAISKRKGNWEIVETPAFKLTKAQMKKQNEYLEKNIADKRLTLANVIKKLEKEIEEHKRTEEALQKSEANLRTIFDNTDTGYVLLDMESRIVSFNQLASDFIKKEFHAAAKPGESILSYFSEEERPFQEQRIKEVLEGKYVNFEASYLQPGNLLNWYYVRLFPISNNEFKIFGFMAATTEITERKKAEEEIKASEERYRYLFDNNPASIFIWDMHSLKIIEVNNTAIEQYGYSREEFLNLKSTFDLRPKEDYERYDEFLKIARAEDTTEGTLLKRSEYWKHLTKSGEIMFMDIWSHKIFYKGKPRILSVGNNVTERVQLEKKLEDERLKKQQEITDAVITAEENERQEIGMELHDNVNQILASARMYLGLTRNELSESHPFLDETDKLVSTAITEIKNLSHSLISPLVNESKLSEALDRIIETTKKNGTLSIRSELKGFDESVISDKLKLAIYRIVQEQFNNILRYAKAKSIYLSLVQENEKIVLTIKDDGVGFDVSEKTGGIGFINIRTRASIFNGETNINSSRGNGCELTVSFLKDTNNFHKK